MALYVILAVAFLGIFHKTDCQTIRLDAPKDVILGSNMTITCTFTDAVGNPNTVSSVQWSYPGATVFTVTTHGCSLFGDLPPVYSGMSITHSCGIHEYFLHFASVMPTTVDNNWCCNVVLNPGPSPPAESCDSPMMRKKYTIQNAPTQPLGDSVPYVFGIFMAGVVVNMVILMVCCCKQRNIYRIAERIQKKW